ncbi:hypothetical protein [Hyalangium versicolor]|uniref:hypothetical protein n=1 Tax=Hyalangium versicolor TaxID=2861190 RepID=UPI001CCEB264|nr:hypothetical protein [Hyalangium versicolor]
MNRALFICLLLCSACSAEISVETEPFNQKVPVTSLLEPVYAEVAIDVPDEAVGDVIVDEISADLTVVNPAKALTLETGVRLSLSGKATPEDPVLYTNTNLPAYFNTASILLPTQAFAPGQSKPFTIKDPVLVKAAGKPRIWLIVNNTVKRVGLGTDTLPLDILLQNIVFRATVTKPFNGVAGGLEVGGL